MVKRRHLLLGSVGATVMGGFPMQGVRAQSGGFRRVRPSDTAWPAQERWDELKRQVGGRLIPVRSPLTACVGKPASPDCNALFKQLRNPYFIGDDPALTQTLGWVGGWTSQPSVYAVAAENTADVVAAVNFARENRLRLVVKGGGHSYLGTSNAADSLLIWTRRMNAVTLHDAFVPKGCNGTVKPQPAVSLGAGAMWLQAYDAVTTRAGRYVQGGGCTTVGVAGLIQSGGFGSFSKRYGLAAASLLEAEIVTADGAVRTVNACSDPELFWALKGGGGGSLGVVTRLTLKTHDLPPFFGIVHVGISAKSDAAFRQLIDRLVNLYAERLFNPHWGEQMVFRANNTVEVTMVFQGIEQHQAEDTWRPFFDWVTASKQDYEVIAPPFVVGVPARALWNPTVLKQVPGLVVADDRSDAPEGNIFWAGDAGQVGQVLYGYQSTWLPASLLHADSRARLVDALFAASRRWGAALHFNKGLAGAPDDALAAARDTATNPAVVDAFALAIIAANAPPAYPGVAGHEPDKAAAQARAEATEKAMQELRKLVPNPGSYVSETNFHEKDWQQAFWGPNYPRLQAAKQKYDPEGLFFAHHGVGSEKWSSDGFTQLAP
jgi:FAD/FMN-containing dehydrogenase